MVQKSATASKQKCFFKRSNSDKTHSSLYMSSLQAALWQYTCIVHPAIAFVFISYHTLNLHLMVPAITPKYIFLKLFFPHSVNTNELCDLLEKCHEWNRCRDPWSFNSTCHVVILLLPKRHFTIIIYSELHRWVMRFVPWTLSLSELATADMTIWFLPMDVCFWRWAVAPAADPVL